MSKSVLPRFGPRSPDTMRSRVKREERVEDFRSRAAAPGAVCGALPKRAAEFSDPKDVIYLFREKIAHLFEDDL